MILYEKLLDYSGMSDNTKLYIVNLFYKAFGEVNQGGKEVAKETIRIINTKPILHKQLILLFWASKNFIFIIKDNNTVVKLINRNGIWTKEVEKRGIKWER